MKKNIYADIHTLPKDYRENTCTLTVANERKEVGQFKINYLDLHY